MKKRSILLSTAVLMTTLFTSIISQGAIAAEGDKRLKGKSGNGDGYQGPTLSPETISFSTDKLISTDKFSKVVYSCLFYKEMRSNTNSTDGKIFREDKNPIGLFDHLLEPLMFEQGGLTYIEEKWGQKDTHIINYLNNSDAEFYLRFAKNENDTMTQINFQGKFLVPNPVKDKDYIGHENNFTLQYGGMVVNTLNLRKVYPWQHEKHIFIQRNLHIDQFPIFLAKGKKLINIYDEISGDLIRTEEYIEGLQIQYDQKNNAPIVKAKNTLTDRETELSAHVADFTSCVIDGVSKL